MAVGLVQPFKADAPANTVTVAASTTAATGTLPATPGDAVLVFNSTTGIAFVRVDGSTATATAADIPVPAGGRMILSVSQYSTVVAVILSTSTGSVYFTRGTGSAY